MNVFFATPIEGGFSWALTTRLGEMLRMAQAEFGGRDKSYTFLSIEFQEKLTADLAPRQLRLHCNTTQHNYS
jgi:hypothetical protein